jgi:hypothetical protein
LSTFRKSPAGVLAAAVAVEDQIGLLVWMTLEPRHAQRAPDPWPAVTAPGSVVDGLDVYQQRRVAQMATRRGACLTGDMGVAAHADLKPGIAP